MNVLIVGCGSIGSILAFHISKVSQVYVYDTWSEHVEALNNNGIRISGRRDGQSTNIIAVTNMKQLKSINFDYAIFAVKSIHTQTAAKDVSPYITTNTTSLTVQNGIGNEEIIKNTIKGDICHGVTSLAGTLLEPGHVRQERDGKIWVGPFKEDSFEKAKEFSAILFESGLDITAMEDTRGVIWSNFLFNCAINPLTTVLSLPSRELIEIPYACNIMRSILAEGKEVAKSFGIRLMQDPEETVFASRQLSGVAHLSSMAQDILKGRKTEIDFLNGAIVNKGKQLGIDTPTNELMTNLIKSLEWKNDVFYTNKGGFSI